MDGCSGCIGTPQGGAQSPMDRKGPVSAGLPVDFVPVCQDFRAGAASLCQRRCLQPCEASERKCTIRRPMRPVQPQKDGPRSNNEINVPEVQLITADGNNIGVVRTSEAIAMAMDAGMDL